MTQNDVIVHHQSTPGGIPPASRGQPQVEVTSNVILNVDADDKGTSKSGKVASMNDNGRLKEEQNEKMTKEAVDEDKKVKKRVDATECFRRREWPPACPWRGSK